MQLRHDYLQVLTISMEEIVSSNYCQPRSVSKANAATDAPIMVSKAWSTLDDPVTKQALRDQVSEAGLQTSDPLQTGRRIWLQKAPPTENTPPVSGSTQYTGANSDRGQVCCQIEPSTSMELAAELRGLMVRRLNSSN